MNLVELVSLFRSEAFDKVQPYLFSDEDVKIWLNEALIEACIRKQLIRENTSIFFTQYDIVQGVRVYPKDPRMAEIVYANFLYKGQNGMIPWQLGLTSSSVMDDFSYAWRTIPYRPTALIIYDNTLEPNCMPNAAYTVHCEGYRLPKWKMDDTPVNEVLASGTLELTGGTGTLDTITVNGIDILGSSIAFNTSLTQTAVDLVNQINSNQVKVTATSVGPIITLTDIPDTGRLHNGYLINATGSLTFNTTPFAGGVDAIVTVPEINTTHHRFLCKWALHRGYERPDTETMDKNKSATSLADFEAYFGTRPDAELRKQNNATTPHRNLAYS